MDNIKHGSKIMVATIDHVDVSNVLVSVRDENGKVENKAVKDLTEEEINILSDNLNKQLVYPLRGIT